MNSEKPLIISKKAKVSGLHTYCSKCDRLTTSGKCGKTKKKLYTCAFGESHKYKAFVEIPSCKTRKKKSRTFNTRDLKRAIVLKMEFEEEMMANNYQSTDILVAQSEAKPELIIEWMSKYLGFLNNEGVPKQKQKKRSETYIKEMEKSFLLFCESLKNKNLDHTILSISSINDKIVEIFHDYLKEVKKYSNRTYNNNMGNLRRFVTWSIKRCNFTMLNPFENITRLVVARNNEIIEQDEFKDLLALVKPENGVQISSNGIRRMMYKNWMKDAFIFALETGLRREEYMTIRFCDIIEGKDGTPSFIKIENYKVNRQKGIEEEASKQFKIVPVTIDLKKLIQDKDYNDKKKSEQFLLGSDEKSSRSTLIDKVSKAFTHFWKQTKHERDISLKHLRKTYLTALANHFGDHANLISDHASMTVLKKHYLNNKKLVEQAGTFSVFGGTENQ